MSIALATVLTTGGWSRNGMFASKAPMIADKWTDPLTLFLIGAVLVLVGLIVGWAVQAVRSWRPRKSR